MGFYFYPRGGSAQVARYLSRSLAGGRWAPTLFAGSLGGAAQACNARHFFGGVRCEPLDYTPAADAWSAGCDPMAMAVPMHAPYESKAGVPDRVFGDLDDRAYDLQVASWVGFLSERAVGVPSVVHLHHLTPMHAAVRRVWPRVPLITHLHGTELKMLAAIRDDPLDLECGRYGVAWATRMQSWAGRSDRVVVVSATDHALALDLLPLDPGRAVTIASGVDTDVFEPKVRAWSERLALWRRWLVDDPADGDRVARRAPSGTPHTTCRRSPTTPGDRCPWCCSPVASCASSDFSCSSRRTTRCGRSRATDPCS